jgi:hypothetical protein
VSLAWLVGFQGFRLPLELVLHDWYASGTIPETMTWSGSNWDILSGIFALLSCFFVNDRRWLAWVFNIVGIILLLNVGRVAIMSSPVPFGWQVDPPLELILFLPYAFIVPICVGGAALGHTLLTRKLLLARDFNSQDLNGLNSDAKPKILGIGKGTHELDMIRTVIESGFSGPIGIIDHREQIDARESLLENISGLQSVRQKLE